MNPLLQQFLEEGAELLESVEAGLLALERDPRDAATLNEVFRAAHTFKGSSGLFDLPELTRLTHACEDVLDRARDGGLRVGAEVVDRLNAAFDLVRDWLGHLASDGVLPAGAGAAGAAVGDDLRRFLAEGVDGADGVAPVEGAVGGGVDVGAGGATAGVDGSGAWRVAYRPEPGAFFRGDDPLHLVAQIPELAELHLVTAGPWPTVDDLDEYDCAVGFDAVSRGARAELDHLFRFNVDEVTITPVPALVAGREGAVGVLTDGARDLVGAQARMLAAAGRADGFAGRVRSAASVLRRVAGQAGPGCGVTQDDVDAAEAASLAASTPDALAAVAARLLAGDTVPDAPDALDALDAPGGVVLVAPPSAALSIVDAEAGPAGGSAGAPAARPLKVDQAKVDRLLELAGELVVAKNALPFLARAAEAIDGADALARQIKDQYTAMNRLAAELQQAVMDIRMVPVSTAWQRFPRMVRDLGRKLGKQVRLVTEGDHTQADKDVLELLGEPLLHLVRNSLDHGLEGPDERRAAGKPAEGVLRLVASQEADSVLIRIADDGRGIDPAALRRRAVARGLLDADAVARLDDREALDLIFLAGFSTAEAITDVSGRGVGMDVVRSTIQRLGGAVSLESTPGAGTTVTLRMPLTMSVMSVMTVAVGAQRFGVPLDLVRETVRVPLAEVGRVAGNPTLALRRGLVPVVDLAGALGVAAEAHPEHLTACVVRLDGHDVALAVDRFHENVDVILKPLDGVMRRVRGYAGTALMGDGGVMLVLDLNEVVLRARAS